MSSFTAGYYASKQDMVSFAFFMEGYYASK